MPSLLFGLFLIALKYFEINPVARWDWWMVLIPIGIAFAWFEGVERLVGWDKHKARARHDKFEKKQAERRRELLYGTDKMPKRR